MKPFNTLFVIPMYLRSRKRYYADAEKAKKELIERFCEQFPEEMRSDSTVKKSAEGLAEDNSWPPWQFNDIVGYIVLDWDGGTRFRGRIFAEKGKRHSRNALRRSRRPIVYLRETEDEQVSSLLGRFREKSTNQEIREALERLLNRFEQMARKSNRYIDLTVVRVILKHLDLKSFLASMEEQ